MKSAQARQVGQLMCDTTVDVLWRPAAGWVRDRTPGSFLICRVGSGQATYHRFDPQQQQHLITYGVRMIEAKHQPDTASGWLSSREIRRRGYFGGQLSPLNLLAHTCCHEFAHLLQQSAGQRFRGSVHNRHFYGILDGLYESGGADATRQALADRAAGAGVALSDVAFELPDPVVERSHWQVGEAVAFGSGPREVRGNILRVNRKTCTVRATGHARSARYRVPIQMLRRVN
ncbi:hypothetical protein BKP64_14485 [Marinobacter salinus]|uniref:SprT-like domain-containing protein n=1 Tax=Marinobacter salinus TaxID=1874317 RepID=A0A1D9GPE7_9GAMM|nr:hypothetical protein [Marinobacter salinus]AOY89280.1 hypothetical protein BKP64_14485 [Marinobacter salinus]